MLDRVVVKGENGIEMKRVGLVTTENYMEGLFTRKCLEAQCSEHPVKSPGSNHTPPIAESVGSIALCSLSQRPVLDTTYSAPAKKLKVNLTLPLEVDQMTTMDS